MSESLPKALIELIEQFSALPGVGKRTAERYSYYIYKKDPHYAQRLSSAIVNLHDNIKICPKTFALIDKSEEFSPLYSKPDRDKHTIVVVAEPFDILAIENTNVYKGTYHVLGGLISPLDNINPENLRLNELFERINKDEVNEVIIATNASVEGETTALYIQKHITNKDIKLTRLARGLPIGVDLEYADQMTLVKALQGRTSL